MLRYIVLIITSLTSISLGAQSLEDGLRHSLFSYQNTARSAGVAGSFAALGADVSTISTNPAGLAEFRRSEISGSLNFRTTDIDATHAGNTSNMSANQTTMSNLVAVFHNDPFSPSVQTRNFALGVTQLAGYKETISYQGSSAGTIVQRFQERAETRTLDELDDFEGGVAYDAGAIYDFEEDRAYETDFDFDGFGQTVQRDETITRSGRLHEFSIAMGSNINNKFSWGVAIGFPFGKFEESRIYNESDPNDDIEIFNRLAYRQELSTTTVGTNLKIGAIYKVNPRFRLGYALHSPTFFIIEDDFGTSMNYSIISDNGPETFSAASPAFDVFEYNLISPWRAIAGAGYLFKTASNLKGFVSGEIEFVGYSATKFYLTTELNGPEFQAQENELNEIIDNDISSAFNFRIGSELAYNAFRVRAGVSVPSGPYSDDTIYSPGLSLNGGVGYRANRFYVDAAFNRNTDDQTYSPYLLVDQSQEPQVNIARTQTNITVTLGVKI